MLVILVTYIQSVDRLSDVVERFNINFVISLLLELTGEETLKCVLTRNLVNFFIGTRVLACYMMSYCTTDVLYCMTDVLYIYNEQKLKQKNKRKKNERENFKKLKMVMERSRVNRVRGGGADYKLNKR